jgi:SAM-dependent methyltransferase
MSSSYRNELNKWLADLEVYGGRVLDIGGSQEQVKNRVKSWNVDEYLIADLHEPHKGRQPDIEVDLNIPIEVEIEPFDKIFCLEVFEYIYDPVTAMKNIAELLVLHGIAYVSFPSIYPLHEPVDDDCLRYMPAGITNIVEKARMQVLEFIPREMETDAWLHTISAERFRAAKNKNHLISGWIVKLEKVWR